MRVFIEEILMFGQRQTGGGFGGGALPPDLGGAINAGVSQAGKIAFYAFLAVTLICVAGPLLGAGFKAFSNKDEQGQAKKNPKEIVSDLIKQEAIVISVFLILGTIYGAVPIINQGAKPS